VQRTGQIEQPIAGRDGQVLLIQMALDQFSSHAAGLPQVLAAGRQIFRGSRRIQTEIHFPGQKQIKQNRSLTHGPFLF
jgi:hypothetical protein